MTLLSLILPRRLCGLSFGLDNRLGLGARNMDGFATDSLIMVLVREGTELTELMDGVRTARTSLLPLEARPYSR